MNTLARKTAYFALYIFFAYWYYYFENLFEKGAKFPGPYVGAFLKVLTAVVYALVVLLFAQGSKELATGDRKWAKLAWAGIGIGDILLGLKLDIPGIAVFIGFHVFSIRRLTRGCTRAFFKEALLGMTVIALVLGGIIASLLPTIYKADQSLAFSITAYAVVLVVSLCSGWLAIKIGRLPKANANLAFVGLIAFAMDDIGVALEMTTGSTLAFCMVWTIYGVALTCLFLSAFNLKSLFGHASAMSTAGRVAVLFGLALSLMCYGSYNSLDLTFLYYGWHDWTRIPPECLFSGVIKVVISVVLGAIVIVFAKGETYMKLCWFFIATGDVVLGFRWHVPGILLFLLAHVCSILRHTKGCKKEHFFEALPTVIVIVCSLGSIVAMLFPSLIESDPVLAISILAYAAVLCCSVSAAYLSVKIGRLPKINAWLSTVGLMLFASDDVGVACDMLLSSENPIKAPLVCYIWVAYGIAITALMLTSFPLEEVFGKPILEEEEEEREKAE